MDASNCVGLYYWARDLGATDLADNALKYICQHFTQVEHSVSSFLSHKKNVKEISCHIISFSLDKLWLLTFYSSTLPPPGL